jgi:ADP-heptose:LPS heptosyltransferase
MDKLPDQLVAEFLSEFDSNGRYSREAIARLAEIATADDQTLAESGTRAVFASLVERLADSFDPRAVSLYNRAFAQLIQASRLRSKPLDSRLESFGIHNEDDLVSRAERLRNAIPLRSDQSIRQVIILSRVTLGADVAITSVIVDRIQQKFPDAKVVIIGGSKASQLLGGNSRLQFNEVSYRRGGTTIERLLSWLDLVECIRNLKRNFGTAECLIIDPDSRLTQLGLLPLEPSIEEVSQSNYLFFPSREFGARTSRSLSQLTTQWLNTIFGEHQTTLPRVSLLTADVEAARRVIKPLRPDTRPIIALNFGVGENPLKRIGGDFESTLILRLLQLGAGLLLDKGAGRHELDRIDQILTDIAGVERNGHALRIAEINENNVMNVTEAPSDQLDILVWNGRIGMLAALIAESDLYLGYDSAGQHIAAALGVNCIDVFAGFSSPMMLDRWRPGGPAETRVIAVDTIRAEPVADAVIDQVLRSVEELLNSSLPSSSRRRRD